MRRVISGHALGLQRFSCGFCVVRFKVLHNSKSGTDAVLSGEEQANLTLLERAAEKKFSNRNYLLVLTGEAVQLYATNLDSDFSRAGDLAGLGDAPAGAPGGGGDDDFASFGSCMLGHAGAGNALGASVAGAEKLVVGAGRLLSQAVSPLVSRTRKTLGSSPTAGAGPTRGGGNGSSGSTPTAAASLYRRSAGGGGGAVADDRAQPADSEGGSVEGGSASRGGGGGEAEDVPPDSIFTLSVALSQVVDVRKVGRSAVVAFRRQKPRVRMMNRAEKLLLPWKDDPRNDPLLRTAVMATCDDATATELVAALQTALSRLADAVKWISRGLPLNDAPCPALITVQPPASSSKGQPAAAAEVAATAPAWGKAVALPPAWCKAAAAAAADGDPGASAAAIVVWLSTPLGPAAATIGVQQLLGDLAEQGKSSVLVEAKPLMPSVAASGEEGAFGRHVRLQVQLQAVVRQLPGRSGSWLSRLSSRDRSDQEPAAGAAPADQGQPDLLALGCVAAAAAAWIQLLASGGLGPARLATALHLLAFLACNLAACLALLPALAARRRPAAGPPLRAASSSLRPAPAPHWTIALQQARLVSADEDDFLQEVASEAGVDAELSLDEALAHGEKKGAEAGPQLPESYRRAIQKHPKALDADIASRFLATYPSPAKGLAAMQQCAEWREQQGYVGLLNQPHPKFERIKARYPHAILGWSTKKDCLVTLDSYGVWKQSYDALKADGVTDEELLRHLMFCFDFNWQMLDTRHLPHGMSVNIIDLGGLKMGDAAGEAFRFISKAGGLLNLHYPGRLHRAFLINAPSWWSIIWRLVSPLIHPDTRKLMALYSAKDKLGTREALLEWVDASILPTEYGGECTTGLYESQLERQLWAHVRSGNKPADGGAAA